MESVKYLGFDVHQSTISVAVVNADGKLVMQSVIATHAATILDFIHGLRGTLHLTFEEGTHSAWLYDLLARGVARVVVCNPRQNALLKAGNKSDTSDARKLAELLRAGLLAPVYHGEGSTRTLQELVRSYAALTEDTTRVMGRVKALYRSQAIACAGKKPYGRRHRREWLSKLNEAVCIAGRSGSTKSWMPCRGCAAPPSESWCWRAASMRRRSCCAPYLCWVRFARRY